MNDAPRALGGVVPPATGSGPDRLNELEIKLAYLDDLLDAVNATVFRQQQQIDRLTQALVELRQQVRSAEAGTPSDPREDIPPHY